MPAVFVHGVPDTQQVWDAVITRLHRQDVVTLSLPGFGCPLPQGFLWGEKDPYASVELGARVAEKTRARFVSFPGCSHWWRLERPAEVAAELERQWATL